MHIQLIHFQLVLVFIIIFLGGGFCCGRVRFRPGPVTVGHGRLRAHLGSLPVVATNTSGAGSLLSLRLPRLGSLVSWCGAGPRLGSRLGSRLRPRLGSRLGSSLGTRLGFWAVSISFFFHLLVRPRATATSGWLRSTSSRLGAGTRFAATLGSRARVPATAPPAAGPLSRWSPPAPGPGAAPGSAMARLVLDELDREGRYQDLCLTFNNCDLTNLDSTTIQLIVIKLVHSPLHVSPGGKLHDP